ncbi:MAG: hypothetical protein IJM15_03465, partial [Erysipelotrichaceae bacterium]|nr:hypothetical protein [Erysipelotrichaceae bacterium]
YLTAKQFPMEQRLHVEAAVSKGRCTFGYRTGESYIYEKKPVQPVFGVPQKKTGQNDTGAWYTTPISLKEQLDGFAASLINQKVKPVVYYDLPESLSQKAKKEFDRQLSNLCEELKLGATTSMIPIGNIFRNYLIDGGIGVYEANDMTVAICFFRVGFELDYVQGQGIYENITGEPFGQADCSMAMASSVGWSVPYFSYMISDKKEDLKDFAVFAETVDQTDELRSYVEQHRKQQVQYQYQKAVMEAQQNQMMINNMFAQQQQQFAAMDRMTNMIHQDLDQFHQNIHAQAAQNDMRFNLGSSSGFGYESSDDRIQRMRHESMMGVETYTRSDGTDVEFDSRADRVFENNLDSTTHFGTHNYFDSYVPEGWHELNKKK